MNHPTDPDQMLTYKVQSTTPLTITFTVEAGHEYEIRVADALNQTAMPWYGGERALVSSVVDRKTGLLIPKVSPVEPSNSAASCPTDLPC